MPSHRVRALESKNSRSLKHPAQTGQVTKSRPPPLSMRRQLLRPTERKELKNFAAGRGFLGALPGQKPRADLGAQ